MILNSRLMNQLELHKSLAIQFI
ncbi:hypothetical protein BDFB_012218 [Asbolus verrucosus]|uniref:Uncharacterized protein n=1 Tax=Asbolus verrucosus TaxID=1661398 RepID=A0A482W1T7_ASBVE|nr:hypothetical protein BDFB_012218 [Asbolus verrucosus]